MENIIALGRSNRKIHSIIFDVLAIAFIYFIPAISHLLALPVYLIEPMRIVVILSLVHTGRINSFLIALTLPLFSYLVSTHPSAVKSLLITSELLLNIWLFLELSKRMKNIFLTMIVSITVSKIFYYIFKYILISAGAIDGQLISTPVYLQLIVIVALSGYTYLILNAKKN